MCMHAKSIQSCPTPCDPMDCMKPTRLLCPCATLGKNTRVGFHFPLQGIFLTQGLNLGLLHSWQILTTGPPGKSPESPGKLLAILIKNREKKVNIRN